MVSTARAKSVPPEPVVIYAKRGFDSYTYSLDLSSERTIERAQHTPSRLTVAFDVKEELEHLHGSLLEQVIPILTGKSLDALAQRGIEVRDARTDRVIWSWPQGRR